MTRRLRLILFAPVALLGFALFVFLGGEIVLQLWNWLIPSLFGWHAVTFWQALGLLALCRILFGRIGGRGFSHVGSRRRFKERWEHMTPEERDQFRKGILGRCGFAPTAEG